MIECSRLIIRPWHLDDAQALYKYASDARVSELAMWPRHTSVDISREVLRTVFMPNPHCFAIELKESGEAVGCIGLVPEGAEHYAVGPGEREVGYWIGYQLWGRGLTSEALAALRDYCRDTLGLHSLIITTDARNKASQRVALKCGFGFIGDFVFDGIASKAFRINLHEIVPDFDGTPR